MTRIRVSLVDLYVLRGAPGALECLLLRRAPGGRCPGSWETVHGHIEDGETPADAARRELREESGYTSERWTVLGPAEPNPAFQNNLCHHYLAEGARRTHELELDPGEDIVVDTLDLPAVRAAVASGAIRHALVISALARVLDLRAGAGIRR